VLEVTFVRKRGHRDHVYVRRDDGSTTDWAFPSYGDGLPHDLCHLVVEDELDLTEGFWGLVDQHVEVGLVDDEAILLRDGEPLADQPGVDLSGLMQAEGAVAALGTPTIEVEMVGPLTVARGAGPDSSGDGPSGNAPFQIAELVGHDLPDTATPEAVAAIRVRLGELASRWRQLDDRGSLTLPFPSPGD
jgi:hypothetical protein